MNQALTCNAGNDVLKKLSNLPSSTKYLQAERHQITKGRVHKDMATDFLLEISRHTDKSRLRVCEMRKDAKRANMGMDCTL